MAVSGKTIPVLFCIRTFKQKTNFVLFIMVTFNSECCNERYTFRILACFPCSIKKERTNRSAVSLESVTKVKSNCWPQGLKKTRLECNRFAQEVKRMRESNKDKRKEAQTISDRHEVSLREDR